MSCLEAGHILSNGPKTTSLCFSSVATSITCEIPAETEFRNSAKTTHVHSSVSALQTFYMVLMVNFNHTNLQICTIHMVILRMGMVCQKLACRCFRKTRCLRLRSRLLTGLLNKIIQKQEFVWGLCKVRMRTADADGGCGRRTKKNIYIYTPLWSYHRALL